MAAAKEAEMQEAERAAAARQTEEDVAKNAAKKKELSEREKAERKAAKKARLALEKAKAQEICQLLKSDRGGNVRRTRSIGDPSQHPCTTLDGSPVHAIRASA